MAAAARKYHRTPYGHQGRNPGARLDCAGVVACAYREAGRPLRDFRSYSLPPAHGVLREHLTRNFGPPRRDRRVGDVVLMWLEKPGNEVHCGVVTGADEVTHVLIGRRVAASRLDGPWGRRIAAVFGVR